MKIMPIYKIMNRPVLVTTKGWYELMSGPFELEDGSFLYLARASGQIFPSKEFCERRYYIRAARKGKTLIPLDETRMGDKLYFRNVQLVRIADRIHDIGNSDWSIHMFGNQPSYIFAPYQFQIAKIHNKQEWMNKAMMPSLANINAEQIKLVDMKLSVHGFKYLKRAEIENLRELASLTPLQLEEICHGNKLVINELEQTVERFGGYFVKLP